MVTKYSVTMGLIVRSGGSRPSDIRPQFGPKITGSGSISLFKEYCFRVRIRVRISVNSNPNPKTVFFKKKIDPDLRSTDTRNYQHKFKWLKKIIK